MKRRRVFHLLCFLPVILACSLASCSKQGGGTNNSASLYDEADRLFGLKRYSTALEYYDKALAADTIKGFGPKALDALCRKSRIEFLTGRYSAAFHTWDAIRQHGGGKLPDSLYSAASLDTGKMYAELGMYSKAASLMADLRNPDPWQRFDHAVLLFKAGDAGGAAKIYGELAESEEPAIRMVGLSGLLDCALLNSVAGLDTPDNYAGKIAAVSGKAMKMAASAEVKIRALRIAAKSLQQLEKQRPNASYLLFRALAIAQQEGFATLVPVLQLESNALIVRKPDTYRSVIEYFGQRNLSFAKVAALSMLGRCEELTPPQRIEALRGALTACRYYGIPATATEYVGMERQAASELNALLIAEGRYNELFDDSAQADFLAQRRRMQTGIAGFRLPDGHEALQNEIVELTTDISGLLQRKITMIEEGTDFRLAPLADKAISEKNGRLIALISEASKIDKTVLSRLQPEQATLRTLQKNLRSDQALVRVFVTDSLSTAMLVSNREMQIVTTKVPADMLRASFSALRQRAASAGESGGGALASDPQRLWLTDTLLRSMTDRLRGYRQLIFVSERPEPFHLLGSGAMLGRDRQVSWTVSTSEAMMSVLPYPAEAKSPGVAFFNASSPEQAAIYKLFHPGDRVFLCWKPMTDSEATGLKSAMQKSFGSGMSGSAFLSKAVSEPATAAGRAWFWLGSYGVE
jgi:tetratricopeptide (TPR) repeat protein